MSNEEKTVLICIYDVYIDDFILMSEDAIISGTVPNVCWQCCSYFKSIICLVPKKVNLFSLCSSHSRATVGKTPA